AFLDFQSCAEQHERVEIEFLKTVAVLEMPIADWLSVEKIAAIAPKGALEVRRRTRLVSFERAPRRPDPGLEARRVEFLDERRVYHVPLGGQRHPLRATQRLAETM